MLHVVLMLFQEINIHSYGALCCSPLTMAHTLFHDVGVEILYTDYSIGYTVRPIHILFRPCGLTLNKRNDRQRSPTADRHYADEFVDVHAPRASVRINVMGVVLSINDRRKRVSGRGPCEPFTKKNSLPARAPHPESIRGRSGKIARPLRLRIAYYYNTDASRRHQCVSI